jgi:mono/diheme cytochrome c family protein
MHRFNAIRIALAALFVGFASNAYGQATKKAPGLALTIATDGGKSDVALSPNVMLYATVGQSPTPFLPPGKFTATWSGFISADLRGDFLFQAELRGGIKVELNSAVILEATAGDESTTPPTKSIRLNKGANLLKVTFTSPAQGDASVRLLWSEKGSLWEPIPSVLLTHDDDAELQQATKVRLGRDLFFEHRCAKCHQVEGQGAPELAMDAPALDGIGSRRGYVWMAGWILDPKGQRASAHMPKVFHGMKGKEDADAVAAYLASLKSDVKPKPSPANATLVEAGKKLAETLNCAGCHNLPGGEKDAKKISLNHAGAKFPPGQLAAFLLKPEANFAWTRMPHFKLSADEAQQVAAFVSSNADRVIALAPPTDATVLERGKQLVQSSGCLNCHVLKLDNRFSSKTLAELSADKWQMGCLSDKPVENAKAPYFAFSAPEREALQAFAKTDRASLMRHAPIEFAERQTRNLNCAACHGQMDGFPHLETIGGKLKPEWMKSFLAGAVDKKPRPWMEARMPAFVSRAELLAHGLAMSHGYPVQTPTEPPIDNALAQIGRKLSGTDGGLSCVSCHSIATQEATQVFEQAGINFSYSGERLQKSYFFRWIRNPLRIEPTTKMPVYFDDEGKSPLTDVLEADAVKQIDSIWQYVRQGAQMQPPGAP